MPPDVPPERAVVVWRRPPDVEEHERKADLARKAEGDARLAKAEAQRKHAEMQVVSADLVLSELKKWLRLSQHEDFQNTIGPVDAATVLKLAEFVSKNFRLDTGQATEHVAHAIGPSIDFGKLTQEERDQWRALALKGGGGGSNA